MKRFIKAIILSICFASIISVSAMAKSKDEAAIRKQIKVIEAGLKNHNYSTIKKVVKKKYSWCDYNKYDKIIGKKFLKQFSKETRLKVLWVETHGNTAEVKIRSEFVDFSSYYYIAHKELWLSSEHSKENFAKKMKELREYLVSRDAKIAPYIYGEFTVTMKKKKGKWIFEEDSNGFFFDAYTLNYKSFVDYCNSIVFTSDF